MLQIKRLRTIRELNEAAALERRIWGLPPIPVHQTYTAANNGGIVLGAYLDGEPVGFLYSFAGFRDGTPYLYSHMLGIVPACRDGGLGRRLKEAQREHALSEGYALIVWTFDPLESRNAYLNLHKLKGRAVKYYEDYYGELDDSLNRQLPTDRLLVEWRIRSRHVEERVDSPPDRVGRLWETALDRQGMPIIAAVPDPDALDSLAEPRYAVPVPDRFQELKRVNGELALEWRIRTRAAFQRLIGAGYVAEDVVRTPRQGTCDYIFARSEDGQLHGGRYE